MPEPEDARAALAGPVIPEGASVTRLMVDLGAREARLERRPAEDLDDLLGGIARVYKLFEDPALVVDDAYDPRATLLLSLGVLSGSPVMTGLRVFFGGFSPLKTSRSGRPGTMWSAGSGKLAVKLRALGLDEIRLTGRLDRPGTLHLSRGAGGEVRGAFLDADDLREKTCHEKIRTLHARYPDAHFAVIGPAGERFSAVRYAGIALSTENQLRSDQPKMRFCGRGGFGGVLGSKNLLAIVADTKDPPFPRPDDTLKAINKKIARGPGSRRFRDADKGDGGGGTWANYEALAPAHAIPEMNFFPTGTDASLALCRPQVEADGRLRIHDEACFRCGIACHKNAYEPAEHRPGGRGRFLAKLDYEPLNLLSSNLGIFDAVRAAELIALADELGLDAISCGTTLAFAMDHNRRAPEEGRPEIAGGLSFGDPGAALKAIGAIGRGELPELGQGTMRLAAQVGGEAYAMHTKGVELPAYLPQTNPGYPWALAGGHMAMRTYLLLVTERETGIDYWTDAITRRGLGILRDDIVGLCKFAAIPTDDVASVVSMELGTEVTKAHLEEAVRRVFLRGYLQERRHGFGPEDYALPAEAHRHHLAIDLPHFNTEAFFAELRERVTARFDEMARERGLAMSG